MTIPATSAIAPAFVHTSAAPDVTLTFASGASPVTASLPTGTYRMSLAPSASDYLRRLAAAVNAALVAAGRAEVFGLSLSNAGLATFTMSAGYTTISIASASARRLGLTSSLLVGSPYVADYPVWHLALLTSTTQPPMQPMQAGGSAVTTGGVAYCVAASATSYRRQVRSRFQPSTPAYRASLGCEATPMYPAPLYLNDLGRADVARDWSVLDVLQSARNARCGVALGNWPLLRGSTSERFWSGYLDGLLGGKVDPLDEAWEAYVEWAVTLCLPSTAPTETRA